MERFKGNDLMSVAPQFTEAVAFGVMNDIISTFHSKDGYAQPNRYEVLIFPPTQFSSGPGDNLSRGAISQKKLFLLNQNLLEIP